MSTPFLRDKPRHLAHVFDMPIPRHDLRVSFVSLTFRRNILVQAKAVQRFLTKKNLREIRQKKKKQVRPLQRHTEDVCKTSQSESKNRRGDSPGNRFPSFFLEPACTSTVRVIFVRGSWHNELYPSTEHGVCGNRKFSPMNHRLAWVHTDSVVVAKPKPCCGERKRVDA